MYQDKQYKLISRANVLLPLDVVPLEYLFFAIHARAEWCC